MRVLVCTLALLALFGAGCASPPHTLDDSPHSSLDATFVPGGNATIQGRVLNENGAWLSGAAMALLGTSLHTTSDAKGAFLFSALAAQTYTLRADLDGYESLEDQVEVSEGQATLVTITLLALDGRGLGFREHLHDYWGDLKELTLVDDAFTQRSSLLTGGSQTPYACIGTTLGINPQNDVQGCYTVPVHLPDGTIVPPGTTSLRVTVAWDVTDYLHSVTLRYSPANTTSPKAFTFAPGQTREIAVVGPMADNGHARWTGWTFTIFQVPTYGDALVLSTDLVNKRLIGDYHVKIVAVKGVVYPEAGHPRYWADSDHLVLAEGLRLNITGPPTPRPRDPGATACGGSSTCFTLPKDKVVPQGTTRLDVTLEYDYTNPALAPLFTEKALAFRTGEHSPASATLADLRVEEGERSAGKVVYHLKVSDLEPDGFYAAKSTWMFLVGKKGHERDDSYVPDCVEIACGQDRFVLRVEAINENWSADKADGRI